MFSSDLLEAIHINSVLELGNLCRYQGGCDLKEIRPARQHRLLAHPHHMCGKLVRDRRARVICRDHITAADIDFLVEREGNGHAGLRLVEISLEGDDTGDLNRSANWQHRQPVAWTYRAREDRAGIAAEVCIRTVDPLHRHPEWPLRSVRSDLDGFEIIKERRPAIPWHRGTRLCDVVPLQRGNRDT